MKRSILIPLNLILAVLVLAAPQSFAESEQVKEIVGECSGGGVVVTASEEATETGVRVLEEGGTAVDAAIAVGFALAVTYPRAGNLGGGGFMLIHQADGNNTFIDFREKAPLSAHRDMYLDSEGKVIRDLSTLGHRAAGVPGTVAGLALAHTEFGNMSWEKLVAPAIKLAEDGFNVSLEAARLLYRIMDKYGSEYPGLSKFQQDDGNPIGPGYRLHQPALASTLRRIAERGGSEFYYGKTAQLIADEMKRGGGLITLEDLHKYRAEIREPVSGTYRDYRIISAPPPSSGGIVLLEILNILEGFPLTEYPPDSDNTVHLIVEAERRAYRDRAQYLGDPDYVDVPVNELISKSYGARMRSGITSRASRSNELNRSWIEGEETTHYSIIDRFGGAVSTTVTLNGSYGSKVVVRGAGFLMNNEMDDFSIKPGVPNMYGLVGGRANEVAPGKRMLSSMAPTIVMRDGEAFLILGSPGGSTIITSVAQVLINILDFCMSPSEALIKPRFHHQYLPDLIYHEENAFSPDLKRKLRERGHRLRKRSSIGDVQLIMKKDQTACGYTDPRLKGCAGAAAN